MCVRVCVRECVHVFMLVECVRPFASLGAWQHTQAPCCTAPSSRLVQPGLRGCTEAPAYLLTQTLAAGTDLGVGARAGGRAVGGVAKGRRRCRRGQGGWLAGTGGGSVGTRVARPPVPSDRAGEGPGRRPPLPPAAQPLPCVHRSCGRAHTHTGTYTHVHRSARPSVRRFLRPSTCGAPAGEARADRRAGGGLMAAKGRKGGCPGGGRAAALASSSVSSLRQRLVRLRQQRRLRRRRRRRRECLPDAPATLRARLITGTML